MVKTLERYWSLISLLLVLLLLTSWFFLPIISAGLALIVMILIPGMVVALLVYRHLQTYQRGEIDRRTLLRNVIVDIAGVLLTIVLAGMAGRWAAQHVGQVVGASSWGILLTILAAMGVGLIVGFVVRQAWGRLTLKRLAAKVDTS